MIALATRHPAHMGPGQWNISPSCIPPSFGEFEHWAQSQSASHPLLRDPQLDPGLQQAFDLQLHWTHDLDRIRAEITVEVQHLVEEAADDTMQWWKDLPPHVAAVYYNPTFDQITQIPVFVQLLRQFQCPGVDTLQADLEQGFATMGLLNHGEGWLPRADGRYSHPLPLDVFHKLNRQQTMNRLQHYKVDECWQSMQQELLEELRLGRLEGPFETPSWWPRSSARLPDIPLVALTNEDIYVAFCFSVKQEDKIRRCEDYRRSFHNSTIEAYDAVPHDDIQKYVELAQSLQPASLTVQVLGTGLSQCLSAISGETSGGLLYGAEYTEWPATISTSSPTFWFQCFGVVLQPGCGRPHLFSKANAPCDSRPLCRRLGSTRGLSTEWISCLRLHFPMLRTSHEAEEGPATSPYSEDPWGGNHGGQGERHSATSCQQ